MKALHWPVFCLKKRRWVLMTRREADAHEERCSSAHVRPMDMDRGWATSYE